MYKILNVRPKTSSTANLAKSSSGPNTGERRDSEQEINDYNITNKSFEKPPSQKLVSAKSRNAARRGRSSHSRMSSTNRSKSSKADYLINVQIDNLKRLRAGGPSSNQMDMSRSGQQS